MRFRYGDEEARPASPATQRRPNPRGAWWWRLATVPILALLFGIRIGIEERALRAGLVGYDDYARRVRWRLIPLVW